MKPAILSMLLALKLVTFTGMAFAAIDGKSAELTATPAGLVGEAEPLSGGYRRKKDPDEKRMVEIATSDRR